MNGNNVSLARAIRGPVVLITVGVLFALNNFTRYHFEQTWPVILIVFGLLSLLRRGTQSWVTPPGSPAGSPPYSYSTTGGGTYRQSPYPGTEPPPEGGTPGTGPVKGGFGTSAPPRPSEPNTPPSGGNV